MLAISIENFNLGPKQNESVNVAGPGAKIGCKLRQYLSKKKKRDRELPTPPLLLGGLVSNWDSLARNRRFSMVNLLGAGKFFSSNWTCQLNSHFNYRQTIMRNLTSFLWVRLMLC